MQIPFFDSRFTVRDLRALRTSYLETSQVRLRQRALDLTLIGLAIVFAAACGRRG